MAAPAGCSVTPPARLALHLDRSSAGRARQLLRQVTCESHHARVLDEAELLTTEVVTNAVRHGGPPITLEVACDGSTGMTVRVTDGKRDDPVLRHAGPYDESGRGVLLVDLLSAAWGVEPSADGGKTVWFSLRSPR